jgi:phage gp46-like protein
VPEETVRTKKIPKAFIKAPATDKHPAQVDVYTEDVIVGTWTRTMFSGSLPAGRKLDLLRRVDAVAEAVKMAREYANQADAVDRKIGAALFDHIFAG